MCDRNVRRVAKSVPLVELDGGALRPGGQLVGSGADRAGCLRCRALLVDDDGGAKTEMKQGPIARVLELEHDRQRIGRLDRIDRGEEGLVLVGRIFPAEALEGKLDVLGGKGLAVLKLDVWPEREGERLGVGRELPFVG